VPVNFLAVNPLAEARHLQADRGVRTKVQLNAAREVDKAGCQLRRICLCLDIFEPKPFLGNFFFEAF